MSRAFRPIGLACLLFGLVALVEERSAMGVVLDLRRAGLVASLAGAVILWARLRRGARMPALSTCRGWDPVPSRPS